MCQVLHFLCTALKGGSKKKREGEEEQRRDQEERRGEGDGKLDDNIKKRKEKKHGGEAVSFQRNIILPKIIKELSFASF